MRAFQFNGKHKLGIGSECITNYMLATPALREKFEEVKKVIQKTQRTELQKKKVAAFAEKYPDVKAMLDELRVIDESLFMKYDEKWEQRFHTYMPQPTGVHKGKSVVYRMEKQLKKNGYPSVKLEKEFAEMWENRDERANKATQMELAQKKHWDDEEAKLQVRAGQNKETFASVEHIYEKVRSNPEKIRGYEYNFIEDMHYRLGSRPDMRVSDKQANWIRNIEERVFGKKLEGGAKSIHLRIGIRLANLGIQPNDWEASFLKTVASFVSQGRELTDKMQKSWNRLFEGKEQSIFAPKDTESAPQNTPQAQPSDENSLPQLDLGVYELPDGSVYVVTSNKEGTRLYAKKLVVTRPRLNADNVPVDFDFVYDRGAIYNIKPEHKMSLERAKKLTIQYSRCIRCGRHLKAAESVERGIGPICIKAFQ